MLILVQMKHATPAVLPIIIINIIVDRQQQQHLYPSHQFPFTRTIEFYKFVMLRCIVTPIGISFKMENVIFFLSGI